MKELSPNDLIQLIVDLSKVNKKANNYLSSKFQGDEAVAKLFEDAAKKVKEEFFPDHGLPKLRLSDAKKVISTFEKTTNDEKRTLDIMLTFVENGVDFINSYGGIADSFYNSSISYFDKVTLACEHDEQLYKHFSDRLERKVSEASEGWGLDEALADCYYSIGWLDEEDDE